MLRVGAAFELFQVGIAFVLQFFVNADLGSVVPINRHILDGFEEAFFRR